MQYISYTSSTVFSFLPEQIVLVLIPRSQYKDYAGSERQIDTQQLSFKNIKS